MRTLDKLPPALFAPWAMLALAMLAQAAGMRA